MTSASHQDSASQEWPPALVPSDRPRRPAAAPRCTAVEHAVLDAASAAAPAELQAAAFAALLYRYTGQERIALARPDGELRFTVAADAPLNALTAGHGPATGSATVAFTSGPDTAGDGAPYELQLMANGAELALHYDAGLFDRTTALRLLGHYRTLLADALGDAERAVARLRLLTDDELHRVLVEWNATQTELPNQGTLHEAFEARADSAPDAIAVVHGPERLTYAQVNARANQLAHHLRGLGVGPDVRVGLCLDRSAQLLVAELAVLKAGGAYVPLDPDYPADRIATMVGGTSCAVMVSRSDLTANLPADQDGGRPLVLVDRDAATLAAGPEHNVGTTSGPEHLCYIIHTSGSTGKPKPIALRHRGVLNNLADLNTRYGVGPGDAVLTLSSPSFDMSVYEFLGLTIAGGTAVVPEAARTKDPSHWVELIRAESVSVWNSAPALLGLLTDQVEQTGAGPLASLRLALLGGDWVPVPLADRVRAFAPELRFIVMGGATEASIHSTIYEVERADPQWASIPYGRPMANQRAYLLDEELQPVPPGVDGELFLAGTGLARGYLDQPEKTAERFFEWSHGPVQGERLYRTGDLARFTPDGLLLLQGRADFQVKLNGLRVELGEIEAVLRAHDAVRQSVVVAKDGSRLIGYVVPEDPQVAVDTDELTRLAAAKLPDYMVPSAIVVLDRLPLTPNGKLDRLGLPEPQRTGAPYRAPATEREEILAAVFAEVLGVERVGVDDDFLAVGGDSIRAIQVVTRARARGLEVSPRQILQSRTVAVLAPEVTGTDTTAAAASTEPLLTPDPADLAAWQERYPGLADVWPLTALQSGILFESTLSDSGYDAYQMQTVFHLSGPVDAGRMRAAGQALLDRYPSLRVAFVPDSEDNVVQLVVDGVELPWQEVDLSGLADGEREAAFERFLAEDYAAHFDRAVPPLVRLTLVRVGEGRSELVLTTHHVLIDGWSEPILLQDLIRLYAGDGDAAALPEVRGYREFLAWLARQDKQVTAGAWAEELAGVDEPTLLAPATAPRARSTDGAGEVSLGLSEEFSRRLTARASELGVTVNTLVQGAWAVLLGELTGRRDVVFGATVSGRPATLPGVESMVGLFINTLPVRVRCTPGDSLADLVTDLQGRQTALLDHHHHSLTEIHQATGLETLFDTLVAFQSYPVDHAGIAEASAAAGFEVAGIQAEGAANFPLALIVETDPHVQLTLQYHQGRFGEGVVESIAARLDGVLGQFVSDPARTVASVDVLLDAERARLGAPAAAEGAGDTLPALFERQAADAPDAVALVLAEGSLSYGGLNARANRVARALTRRGAGPETVVGIALPRSAELAVAVLGTLKSGAGYVLLDPAAEQERDQLLAEPATADVLTAVDVADILGPGDGVDPGNPGDADRTAPLCPGHLAALRRPGTADGAPGKAALSHRALAAEAVRFAGSVGLTAGTRLLAASPGADALAFELLAALSAGSSAEVLQDAKSLSDSGGWSGDVISTVAPYLADLLNKSTAPLRAGTVAVTGDVLLGSLAGRVRQAVPGARVVHVYGPAGTVRGAAYDATDASGDGRLPLASSAADSGAYVLNPALRPVPDGVTGTLYVAGDVARGYQDRPGASAERFVADPYGPAGARMYRTGDLARIGADGSLEYVGPGGDLPRIRGHRVRAGDVEAVLAAHPDVAQAAVLAQEGDGGGVQLVGYVVPLPAAGELDTDAVRAFAAGRLPEYLVPASVVALAELPLTADGTVDAAAVTESGGDDAGGYRKGRTPQEEALCELFAEVLGVERVGIDDNIFALGCNSLKATRIIGRMRRTLQLEASIRLLFQHATIAELSGHLKAAKSRPSLGRARDGAGPVRAAARE
ncbi:amino acid adenylation domain-containing protein [Streptomyces sp. NPDC059009]|uniref:amino acid adenylation domain-containing protein n=1 Tax=Streptomyces sp. NPDC059009 TaxID=3346694 RepID=UPI0036BEE4C9